MANRSMTDPLFGVPQGNVRMENPDGVFLGSPNNHNLYDTALIREPLIPGDFDRNLSVTPEDTKT